MIDILFIAQNSHQYNYFNTLSKNLPFSSKVIKPIYPFYKSVVNIKLDKKKEEIFLKYPPFKAKLYYKYIKFITPFFEANYSYLIKKYNPKIVALWNGIKYPQNIATIIAKKEGLKTLFFENGFLPNTTQMDFRGVNNLNSIPRDKSFYENIELKEFKINQELEKREFVGKQIINSITLPKKYIFVPFQVAYDSQIIYFSKIKSMNELFFLMQDIADKLSINIVFKEHPSDRVSNYSKLHDIANNSKNLFFANSIDTKTLIQNADSIVTINSSVGIEALLFEKKVYVLGDAFYRIDKITTPATTNNLLDKIKQNSCVDKELIKKFLYYLTSYLIQDSWKNPTKAHFKEIENRISKCLQ